MVHIPERTAPDNLDYDALRVEIEERQFREKMFDALREDERLDDLEARFNGFAHMPEHWKSTAQGKLSARVFDTDEYLKMDPNVLDDEEYAEWIRIGMYRFDIKYINLLIRVN